MRSAEARRARERGARLVLPALVPPFLAAYPDILLDVIVNESFVDVLASGCDAAMRYGKRLEQDMMAIPIGPRRQRMATTRPRPGCPGPT